MMYNKKRLKMKQKLPERSVPIGIDIEERLN